MKDKHKKQLIRLPNHILPISYNLTIKPDLESFTFSGSEIIKIKIKKETNQITLHSKNIDIETAKINDQFAKKIICNTKTETATFYFKNKIEIGINNLRIVFSGIINDGLRGLYKSKYILDGKEKYLATTQFEATDARRAFPCFDEPEHKATFKVSLVISDKHTAISNTLPIKIKEHDAGYKIVSFASTPKMSTYLLAFIVGEFEYIQGKTKEGVQVRVFTTAGKKHQSKFALEIAIKSLEFYNEYFNIPYPLPTLDLIAIPDFESAAMENWGAVTFRESAILVDEKNTSLSNKQWVAIVIAHELAHQWFGNLVTMRWWTDLWLNEGFASYMENFCIDKMFPDWHIWDLYLADRYELALRLDSLSNSHPIEIPVNHPDEINEIFDMVSYAKGSAMIRQLAEYIGHDKFRNGLRHYLKKHSYKNTDTVDLWNSFEKESHIPVNKVMSAWTKVTGYPLITLIHNSTSTPGVEIRPYVWRIKQERFFSSRVSARKYNSMEKKKNLWPIPLKYKSNDDKLKLLMTKKTDALIGTSIGKINCEEDTFMRVRYNESTLYKLGEEIRKGLLSVRDRLGIIRDLFALAEGGYIKTSIALQFTLNYKDETEYIVWSEIATGIMKIYNLIHNETFSPVYETFARSLFSPLAQRMGFEKKQKEKHSETFLRSLAISQSAFYGDKKVVEKAKQIFNNRYKHQINADIRGAIYRTVVRNGKDKEWKLFKKLYIEEELHEEKERLGYALATFRDVKLLKQTLDFIMSNHVKSQDAPHLLAMVWQNNYGKDLAWRFIKNNWKIFLKKYGEGGHFLSRLLTPLGGHTSLKDLSDIRKFFAKNPAPGADRTLEQVYEKIESNSAWLKDDKKDIENWLNKNF